MRVIQNLIIGICSILFAFFVSLLIAYNLHLSLLTQAPTIKYNIVDAFALFTDERGRWLFFMLFFIALMIVGIMMYSVSAITFKNKTIKVTPNIRIPQKAGNGEYGTAAFLKENEKKKVFEVATINKKDELIKWLAEHGKDDLSPSGYDGEVRDKKYLKSGGVVVGQNKKGNKIYFVAEDTHSLTIGATRTSKTRTVSLKTLCLQALAGESMLTIDPKGEMSLYLKYFLMRLGYEVVDIDFDNPNKSIQINYLQEIIDYVNNDEINKAIEATRDLTTNLVENRKSGEPIWTNGERSILTCAIISVIWDNVERPMYQTMANVYYFIAKMCKPNRENIIPLMAYLKSLNGVFHPAQLTIDIAEISPSKMRASFYGSALTTLSLFVDPSIYGMMVCTNFDIYATAKRKRAIFIILPDERSTYDPIASLFVLQEYQRLKRESKKYGNRLPIRVNFNWEEIGNFAQISSVKKMLTVGGGAGLRFNLFLQSFAQLDDIYGREVAQIIRDNCETWIYLMTDNGDTRKEISNKIGPYTIRSPSASASMSGGSASYNLTGRDLLKADEIKRIHRPWQLVTSRDNPAIMYSPDISKTIFNDFLGLGNKAHNKELLQKRQNVRKERKIDYHDMKILNLSDYFPDGTLLNENESADEQIPTPTGALSFNNQRPAMTKPIPFKEII